MIQWQCTSLPKGMPTGWDFEKYLFTPGIYDSVELILTSAPYLVKVGVERWTFGSFPQERNALGP